MLYRLAPEHPFPAAVDDTVAVFKDLLKTYEPRNIGLYGTSAGAILTAEVAVKLRQLGLPLPGVLGIFSGNGDFSRTGDSQAIYALNGFSGPLKPPSKQVIQVSNGHPGELRMHSPYFLALCLKGPIKLLGVFTGGSMDRTSDLRIIILRDTRIVIKIMQAFLRVGTPAGLEGAVEHPFEIVYRDLISMPSRTQVSMLECAGNGRVFLIPKENGAQWQSGGVGNAEWTGVPLSAVLEKAGVKSNAVDVMFEGADQGEIKESRNRQVRSTLPGVYPWPKCGTEMFCSLTR